ncbi:MAG: C39 family peptidase [Planctomycetota bacterium]
MELEPNWEETAATIRAQFEAGRRVDAWTALQPHYQRGFAAADPTFLQLAHDLAWWLGFETRRHWLGRRIRTRHPDALWSRTRGLFDALRRGRTLECYEQLLRDDAPAPRDDGEARWHELARARVFAYARIYDRSHEVLDAAAERYGEDCDLVRERAWTLWMQDDTERALETCQSARRRWTENAFVHEQQSWFLLQKRRTDEALQSLDEACATIQCPSLELLYADALVEAGQLEHGRARLERVISEMPLDRHQQTGANMQLARVHRRLGDAHAALQWMQKAGPRMRKWTDRLSSWLDEHPEGGGRHVLQVPFVRQDHSTCSPATMSSLLAYAGIDVDQREIAEQITYDGTASHAELRWARGRDLDVWFFQFDIDVAHQLLDRGLPFALSTRAETSGHRQAICGYDRGLGTVIVRDPNFSSLQEMDAEWLDKHMQSRGGDCALLLPKDQSDRVPVELLPLRDEMMLLQELRQAYDERDLARAEQLGADLLAREPSTPRFEAAIRIAYEREDRRERLRLYRERYEQHRDDPYWQYGYAVELRAQDRWQPFVALLERHAGGKSPHQMLMLAEHLRHAAPTRARAEQLARRVTRLMPGRALPVKVVADICWNDLDRREHALALYRLCAALEPHDERLADSYADACALLGRRDEGLAFLQRRVDDIGSTRWEARATLARALDAAHRRSEAIGVLRDALHHADEPEVREQLFDLLLTDSQRAEAKELLQDEARWRPLPLQDARRRLALAERDFAAASDALRQAVELDPQNGGAWAAMLRDTLATEGRDAALQRAAQCIEEHGENPRLLVRVQEFYDEIEERAASEQLMRRLVDEHPTEWWLLGRLTRHLIRSGRAEEAAPHAAVMLEQMPDSLPVVLDAIDVAEETGELARCRALLADAAVRWADEPALLSRRRQLAENAGQSAAAVREAMAKALQGHVPPAQDDLDYLVRVIASDLEDDDVETFLQQLQERFPGDPSLAASRCSWVSDHDAAAAVEIGRKLRDDFPWILSNWILFGRCLRAAGQRQQERDLLQELIDREPSYGQAWVELGESLEQEGRTQEAMATYDRGIENAPSDPTLFGMRASLCWTFGDRDGALQSADRAALLSPDYGWVRRAQVMWRAQIGELDAALRHAEACVRDNPTWRLSYELLATAHEALGDQEQRVAALRQAVRIDPRTGSARAQLLDALLELRKFDEAEQVIAAGLELLGDDPQLHLSRLRIRRLQGELAAAREGLVALLQRHDDFVDGWFELMTWLDDEHRDADLLELCGDPPAAIADNPTPFCYAADVHIRRDELALAERDLRKALERAPDHDWARDRLAHVLLERGKPKRVAELFPGATDPAQQPFHRAAMLCEALARTGERERAEPFFLRLLREPEANVERLRRADEAMRGRDRRAQTALLDRVLTDSEREADVRLHENALTILIAEQDKGFWRRLDRFAAWLPDEDRLEVLARLLYACNGNYRVADIDRWVTRNLQPPIDDTESWARIVYALNDDAGAATAVRLTDGNYRRAGVRGWMLANLSGVHADLDQWDRVEEVSSFALSSDVPADHSVWWHRRFLAECAYRRGEHARCLELCEMETESFPSEKLRVVQLATLARIAMANGWFGRRRAFLAALPEILRLAELSDDESRGPHDRTHLRWWRLFRAAPTVTGLAYACGWRWLRRRLG